MAKSNAVSSPLVSAFNNIAAFNSRTKRELPKMQQDYESFSLLIDREKNALDAINLPKKRKIKELQNLNVGGLFGNPGNLLNSFASGALDAAGLLGGMYPQKGTPGKPQKPSGKPKSPKASGTKIKFGPLKSIGILNAVFAGLDFATGLQEGETVEQAAAGAGGALAGGILGGIIGQAVIPIPGVGFVLGSMAGDFLGGYGADRLYESTVQNKQDEQIDQALKEQKQNVKDKNAYDSFLRKFQSFSDGFTKFLTGFGLMPKAPPSDPPTTSMLDNLHKGLEGENTFIQGNTGDSRGDHFHIGPDWEVYGKPEGFPAARKGAYKIAKNLLSRKISFTFTNAQINVDAENPPDDATLQQYIEQEQNAHVNRKSGSSHAGIDIAAPKGTAIPGIKDVKEIPNGFGVQGRIAGTQAFVGHGSRASRSSPDVIKKEQFASLSSNAGNAPVVTVGDSIAEGIKNESGSAGVAQRSMNPTQVLDMLKTQDLKGKTLRLSSGISNDTSQLDVVRQQLQYAKEQEVAGIQLMGTSMDRQDLAAMNPKLQALANEFPGLVQFTGGFDSTDNIHPDYKKYLGELDAQLKNIDPDAQGGFAPANGLQRAPESIRHYPSYDRPGSTTRIVPVILPSTSSSGGVSGTPSVSGGEGGIQMIPNGVSESAMVNSLMKKIFLTNLNDS